MPCRTPLRSACLVRPIPIQADALLPLPTHGTVAAERRRQEQMQWTVADEQQGRCMEEGLGRNAYGRMKLGMVSRDERATMKWRRSISSII